MLVSRNFDNDFKFFFNGIVSPFLFGIVVSVQYIYKFSRTPLVPSWAITTKNPAALLRHFYKENVILADSCCGCNHLYEY
jgi:hypothetical protein